MVAVFFIYGLAFFVLGLAILIYPKKDSSFKLAQNIWMVACFGILHGINEWLDMAILISQPALIILVLRMLILPLSFLFLVIFGIKMLIQEKGEKFFLVVPVILFSAWALIVSLNEQKLLISDVMARYILCLPGGILTSAALFSQAGQFRKTKLKTIIKSLQLAALAFAFYAILAGIVVKKSNFFPANILNYDTFIYNFGFPVQIARAVCAVTAACGIIYFLRVFHWETQEAIRQSEQRFSMVALSCPIILFGIDTNSVVTFAAGKGLDLIDKKSEEMTGKNISEIFPAVMQFLQNNHKTPAGYEFTSAVTIDGTMFELCYSPVRDREGEITGGIGVAIDITAKAQAQEQIDKYRREMDKNARLLEIGTVGTMMAQEINEPLSIANILLKRLVTEINSKSHEDIFADGVKKTFAEISKVTDKVDKFRSLAQLDSKGETEQVDIYEIIRRLITVFSQNAQNVNLEIVVKNIDAVPFIPISTRQLEQVFFILFRNAVDSADKNKQQKLMIDCRLTGQQIEIQFADTCGGIKPEILPFLFNPFSISDFNAKKINPELVIARQIVLSCGGDIQVENHPGQGTTFNIILPVGENK